MLVRLMVLSVVECSELLCFTEVLSEYCELLCFADVLSSLECSRSLAIKLEVDTVEPRGFSGHSDLLLITSSRSLVGLFNRGAGRGAGDAGKKLWSRE